MSNFITESVECGGPGHNSAIIMFSWSNYQAYSDEEYKTEPKIYFRQQDKTMYGWFQEEICRSVDLSSAQSQYGYRAAFCIEKILASNGLFMVYTDPSLSLASVGSFTSEAGQSQIDYSSITFTEHSASNLPTDVLNYGDTRVVDIDMWELDTNIPIFETATDAAEYIQYGDNIQNAINNNVPSVEGRYFEIINICL